MQKVDIFTPHVTYFNCVITNNNDKTIKTIWKYYQEREEKLLNFSLLLEIYQD